MPVTHIEQAERIATSQVVFGILFIVLFFVVIGYLVRTSDKREQKLMDFHEESKKDSRERENRLMTHLEKNTAEMSAITRELGGIQKEMSEINSRIEDIEKGV